MAVGIAAAIVFLVYFACIPVVLAIKIRAAARMDFGAGISLFEGRFALRQAEKRLSAGKKRLHRIKIFSGMEKASVLRTLKDLIRHARIESLRLSGSIALENAAATALVCGCAEAAKAAFGPLEVSEKITIQLKPDFSGGKSDVEFCGMFSMRAGHIICTALKSAVYLAKGRIQKWKSTRLKIS